jgi:hypothetical protein
MSVEEIKEAVQRLNLEERAEVAACLHSWNNDAWDEQMKRDAASGKLDKLLSEVDADMGEALRRDEELDANPSTGISLEQLDRKVERRRDCSD